MKNNPGTLENDHNINERILYMSFDLCEGKWKLAFSDGNKILVV